MLVGVFGARSLKALVDRKWARPMSSLMPLVAKAKEFTGQERQAVMNRDGTIRSYDELLGHSGYVAEILRERYGEQDLQGKRVGFICEPGSNYVAAQWGIWRAGGCAVPLCTSHPKEELQYILENCEASCILSDNKFGTKAKELSTTQLPVLSAEVVREGHGTDLSFEKDAPWRPDSPAMLIFTSGTTGRPKGVVTTHNALNTQITDQIETWGWTKNDRILNVLPLHHVHGVVNCTAVPLYVGACVEFLEFDAKRIWQRFVMGQFAGGELTVFMAVPTIYVKLINEFDKMDKASQQRASNATQALRLFVSGSAALPTTVMARWEEISGHRMLERYGMTEFAMALSNPLDEKLRNPGYVGLPMPSAKVKLVDEESGEEIDPTSGKSGELLVTGPIVFKEYWNNPEATAASFDQNGWFKTGDIASYDTELNSYRILGRASADIIKSGGYKISGLEIERVCLEHPGIGEIAVLGIPDATYGEKIAAVLTWKPKETPFNQSEFEEWAKDHLAKYKVPRVYRVVDEIPKNAMGKVNKKELRKTMFQ